MILSLEFDEHPPDLAMNVVTFDSEAQVQTHQFSWAKNEAQIVAGGWFGYNLMFDKTYPNESQQIVYGFMENLI